MRKCWNWRPRFNKTLQHWLMRYFIWWGHNEWYCQRVLNTLFLYSMENDIFLCKQMLHSIFFLGNIMQTSVSPEDIIPDTEIFQNLRQDYRRPFELYSTHLPRRSPFSCVLDMVRKYDCYFHSVMIHFHSNFMYKLISNPKKN